MDDEDNLEALLQRVMLLVWESVEGVKGCGRAKGH